ncbi:nucleotidyltransferase domain-containing protein [Ornithinibacillus scapharcae]|uniref:nucleotidyltransferase domain-containing protein n=1 Tax=Ornithinibacillus scapharcae TaxID=1147159 RepID=UPI000225ADCE|nr:nucleotidyltransferase domain-containing protein [Ornithinibacillus scapharcae]
MGLKHKERDSNLPELRKQLLRSALDDLMNDPNVLGIYESGSLARGDFDHYSDIDLHIVVRSEVKEGYIAEKKSRSAKWGDVLFYEGSASTPYIVTHYECFVKIDTWYHEKKDLAPSIWLQGAKTYHDPELIIQKVIDESKNIAFNVSTDEIIFWRNKVFAFVHETYRAVMRGELYDALTNLDHVRWFIASAWYTERGVYLYNSYHVWSKIERENTVLSQEQLELLKNWDCDRNATKIMKTISAIYPEFIRLNTVLSNKVGISDDKGLCRKVFDLIL